MPLVPLPSGYVNSLLLNMAIEIVDFPMKHGDFPSFFVCLPEASPCRKLHMLTAAEVMNEGPGHVPLHKIPDNMRKQLDWCHEESS